MAAANVIAHQAARQLAEARRVAWPYPWIYRPVSGIPVNKRGSAVAPGFGVANTVALITYIVPAGYYFILTHVMNQYVGTGFVEGQGNVIFSIDVNRPLAGALASGWSVPDFAEIRTSLGSWQSGPWPVPGQWMFFDGDVVRYKARTVAVVGTGGSNFVHAAMLGWIYPMEKTD